jgi:hypothetical protein
MEPMRTLGHYLQTKPKIQGHRRKRKGTTKGIENIFNKIIIENFPNIKKETDIPV